MYLIIDSGNSYLKATIYNKNKKQIAFYEIKNQLISVNFFTKIFKSHSIDKCFIGSVTPKLLTKVIRNINKISKVKINIIKTSDFNKELNLSKFDLKEVGIDILAYALYLKKTYANAIGVCFGTSLFVIGVSKSTLHGAIILPPIELGLKQLEKNTELIKINWKNIKNNNKNLDFGYDTSTALISGINHTYNGIVISIYNHFYKTLKLNKLCITGGNQNKLNIDKHSIIHTNVYRVDNAVTKGYAYLIFKNVKMV